MRSEFENRTVETFSEKAERLENETVRREEKNPRFCRVNDEKEEERSGRRKEKREKGENERF